MMRLPVAVMVDDVLRHLEGSHAAFEPSARAERDHRRFCGVTQLCYLRYMAHMLRKYNDISRHTCMVRLVPPMLLAHCYYYHDHIITL